jgi:hypothetical protein
MKGKSQNDNSSSFLSLIFSITNLLFQKHSLFPFSFLKKGLEMIQNYKETLFPCHFILKNRNLFSSKKYPILLFHQKKRLKIKKNPFKK